MEWDIESLYYIAAVKMSLQWGLGAPMMDFKHVLVFTMFESVHEKSLVHIACWKQY